MPPARRRNGCNKKIPKAVVDRMKDAGVDFTAAQYQGRDILKCGVGDDAARIYLEWIDTVSDDPDVFAIGAPKPTRLFLMHLPFKWPILPEEMFQRSPLLLRGSSPYPSRCTTRVLPGPT
jgi:hypothetical protein